MKAPVRRAAPRSIAVFGDMPHHRDAQGELHGLAPVVAQLDRWAELFEEVVLCGPLLDGPPPSGFAPYAAGNVRMEALPRAGGNTLGAKLAMVARVPLWAWRTRRVARSVDAVHLRCPCNIAMVALLTTWKAAPFRYGMYAGVWRPYAGEPRFFRYQRELLGSRWFDGPVSMYASADPARPNLVPFFSPSHDLADWTAAGPAVAVKRERIADTANNGPWHVVVVGRLTPNKNQQSAVAVVERLVAAGHDVSLSVLGDGPERARLVEQVATAGLTDRVRFEGMVDHSRVLEVFALADVQLLTTRQEGYGKVLLEGMVSGVVPVFSHSPVATEISGGGSRGIVIDPDDVQGAADAVAGLIADRARWTAMLDDAREATRHLTLDSFAGRVRDMLEAQWNVRFDAPKAEDR